MTERADEPADGGCAEELFPDATPLLDNGLEAAASSIKLIVAAAGHFVVEGRERGAFVVGPRLIPVPVPYSSDAACRE